MVQNQENVKQQLRKKMQISHVSKHEYSLLLLLLLLSLLLSLEQHITSFFVEIGIWIAQI